MSSHPSESDLLKSVLEPLLLDFQYWFTRSRAFLETETIDFLGPEKQSELLQKVIQAQQEVAAARLLFQATEGTVGVEARVLMPWHWLITECWQVAMRFRQEQTGNALSSESSS